MKKAEFILIASFFIMTIFSCSKEKAPLITGEWKVTDIAFSEKVSPEMEVALKETLEETKKSSSWTINENGTFTRKIGEDSSSGKWVLSPDSKKLTLTYQDGEIEVSDILELTENKLVVTYRIDETEYKNTYEKKTAVSN
ncbi:MAG: lipocalin family protein [Bacteroidales bacterium]